MEKKRKIPRSKRQKYTNNQNRVIPKKKPTKRTNGLAKSQTNISRCQKYIKDTGTYHTIAKESSYDAMQLCSLHNCYF